MRQESKGLALKSQDIFVLLKLVVEENRKNSWSYQSLADELGISSSVAFEAISRAKAARLAVKGSKEAQVKVARRSLEEFLLHGMKYAFPASIGPCRRGIPTAHSSAPLNRSILASENYVWEYSGGPAQGDILIPLHPSAPPAAQKDPELHELLALVDALRIGRSRERVLAAEELHQRLAASSSINYAS